MNTPLAALGLVAVLAVGCASGPAEAPAVGDAVGELGDPALDRCIDALNGVPCSVEGAFLGYCDCSGPRHTGVPYQVVIACCVLGHGRVQTCTDTIFHPSCGPPDAGLPDTAPLEAGSDAAADTAVAADAVEGG